MKCNYLPSIKFSLFLPSSHESMILKVKLKEKNIKVKKKGDVDWDIFGIKQHIFEKFESHYVYTYENLNRIKS